MLQYVKKKFQQTTFHYKLVLTYVLIIAIPVFSALSFNSIQLYNQTKQDYENILEQLNRRTNVIVDDFFTNLTRNSFFYLTESRLHYIMSKTKPQSSVQYNLDTNYMQSAMEQFVLMNGNISTISALAPNGSVYGSKHASRDTIFETVDKLGKDMIRSSSFVVYVPESVRPSLRKNQQISIIRYLSDLIVRDSMEGYVKIDVNFSAIEHMLGGITDTEPKLGTMVVADDHMIYTSEARMSQLEQAEIDNINRSFADLTVNDHQIAQLEWSGQTFLVGASMNQTTGWKIIQFIPADQMTNAFIRNAINYVLFGIVALLAAFLLAFFFNRYFINPILRLSKAMKTIDADHIHNAMPWSEREDEIGRLINSYNAMLERLQKSREAELISGNLQRKAEMRMLQAQINPHFLYNTLNAIHAISELNRLDDISTMTKSLSSMYRFNIKYGDEVTIEKELEQIQHYVSIQQIRFLNRFHVEYDISPDAMQCKILKFLVQPIVENSFYHGLEPKGGKGLLKLSIHRKGHTLAIQVADDGVGISETKIQELTAMFEHDDEPSEKEEFPQEHNFGLRNVHARIKHYYGQGYWMKVSRNELGGTTIEMSIPVIEEVKPDEYRNRG